MTDNKNFDEKKKALNEEALDEVAGGSINTLKVNAGAKPVPTGGVLKTIKI